MSPTDVIGLSVFVLTVVAHSAVIAYWGGGIRADVKTLAAQMVNVVVSTKQNDDRVVSVERRVAVLEDREGRKE